MDCLRDPHPLPPDWTQHLSRSHPGLCYYYNKQTGENLWSRPGPDGIVVTSEMKIASSNTVNTDSNTTGLPCSSEGMAWSLGCLIGQIFNPDRHYKNLNLADLNNIPENIQAFYKRCLNKNLLKRPSIDMLRIFLGQWSHHGQDEDGAGGGGGGRGQLLEPQLGAQPQHLAGGGGSGQSVGPQQERDSVQQVQPQQGGCGGRPVPGKGEVRGGVIDQEVGSALMEFGGIAAARRTSNVETDISENELKHWNDESGDVDDDVGNAGVGECPGKHTCPLCNKQYSRRQH